LTNKLAGDLLSHVYADDDIRFIQFSPDSSKVLCITDDQLIIVWDVSHSPLDAATVTCNYPEHLPLTKDSMTDDQGWFRGRDGEQLLWFPVAFYQDSQHWAFEPDGKLTIVGKGQAPLFIDASDYIDNVETVKMDWHRGTVCSLPTYDDWDTSKHPQRVFQRALVDNCLV
jgi:hypothetical protein